MLENAWKSTGVTTETMRNEFARGRNAHYNFAKILMREEGFTTDVKRWSEQYVTHTEVNIHKSSIRIEASDDDNDKDRIDKMVMLSNGMVDDLHGIQRLINELIRKADDMIGQTNFPAGSVSEMLTTIQNQFPAAAVDTQVSANESTAVREDANDDFNVIEGSDNTYETDETDDEDKNRAAVNELTEAVFFHQGTDDQKSVLRNNMRTVLTNDVLLDSLKFHAGVERMSNINFALLLYKLTYHLKYDRYPDDNDISCAWQHLENLTDSDSDLTVDNWVEYGPSAYEALFLREPFNESSSGGIDDNVCIIQGDLTNDASQTRARLAGGSTGVMLPSAGSAVQLGRHIWLMFISICGTLARGVVRFFPWNKIFTKVFGVEAGRILKKNLEGLKGKLTSLFAEADVAKNVGVATRQSRSDPLHVTVYGHRCTTMTSSLRVGVPNNATPEYVDVDASGSMRVAVSTTERIRAIESVRAVSTATAFVGRHFLQSTVNSPAERTWYVPVYMNVSTGGTNGAVSTKWDLGKSVVALTPRDVRQAAETARLKRMRDHSANLVCSSGGSDPLSYDTTHLDMDPTAVATLGVIFVREAAKELLLNKGLSEDKKFVVDRSVSSISSAVRARANACANALSTLANSRGPVFRAHDVVDGVDVHSDPFFATSDAGLDALASLQHAGLDARSAIWREEVSVAMGVEAINRIAKRIRARVADLKHGRTVPFEPLLSAIGFSALVKKPPRVDVNVGGINLPEDVTATFNPEQAELYGSHLLLPFKRSAKPTPTLSSLDTLNRLVWCCLSLQLERNVRYALENSDLDTTFASLNVDETDFLVRFGRFSAPSSLYDVSPEPMAGCTPVDMKLALNELQECVHTERCNFEIAPRANLHKKSPLVVTLSSKTAHSVHTIQYTMSCPDGGGSDTSCVLWNAFRRPVCMWQSRRNRQQTCLCQRQGAARPIGGVLGTALAATSLGKLRPKVCIDDVGPTELNTIRNKLTSAIEHHEDYLLPVSVVASVISSG